MNLEGAAEESIAPIAPPQRVAVVNLDMEFGTMVWFLVKLAVAAIPAAIILAMIVSLIAAILGRGLLNS